MSTIRAVFLDRDGTINVNRPDYVKSVAEFEFLPGALEALALLAQLPVMVYVLTNQSAIGRGLMTIEDFIKITEHMDAEIKRAGGHVDGYFHCPHTPDDGCECRKPKTELLERAARIAGVHPRDCVMIGDSESDMQAAYSFGATPILVHTGLGANTILRLGVREIIRMSIQPCGDLLRAVRLVSHLL